MAGIAKTGIAGIGGGLGDVGIVEHDEGVAAAKLHYGFFQMASGVAGQAAADIGRAGKGQGIGFGNGVFHIFVCQPSGSPGQFAANNIKQGGGYTGHAGRGFHQTGIAGAEGWHGKSDNLPHGVVPRHHGQHHAQGLEAYLAEAGLGGDGLVLQKLGGELHIIADEGDGFVHLGFAFAQATADFFANHTGELGFFSFEAVGKGSKHGHTCLHAGRGKAALGGAHFGQALAEGVHAVGGAFV